MIDIQAIKSKYPALAVCKVLGLDGVIKGKEFVARSPHRDDETPRGFSICIEGPNEGMWGEFSHGTELKGKNGECKTGGDIIDLWRFVTGCGTSGEAAAQLDLAMGGRPDLVEEFKQAGTKQPAEQWELIIPAINGPRAHPIRWWTDELPERPDHIYTYVAINGRDILGFVCRWDLPSGKETRPHFLFRRSDGLVKWRWAGITGKDPRPIYHLEKLAAKPRLVWIVEGEKTCDAAQQFAPDGVPVVSWLGGSDTAKHASVGHLRGCECILIPDRDAKFEKDKVTFRPYAKQPGVKAMNEIANKLQALGCKVSIVDYVMGESKDGWDLADAKDEGWTAEQVQEMVSTSARFIPPIKVNIEHQPTGFGDAPIYEPIPLNAWHMLTERQMPYDSWLSYRDMLNAYGISCRENEMTQKIEMVHVKTGMNFIKEELPTLASYNKLSTAHWKEHLRVLSSKNSYHPIVDWVKGKPWDGQSRIGDLFRTLVLGDSDPELSFRLFFRWSVAAIALVMQERLDTNGTSPAAQGALVLVGTQDLQKSRWLASLAPLGAVKTNKGFDVDNKDSVIASTTAWLIEVAELGGCWGKNRAKQDRTKAFFTGNTEEIRKPYTSEPVERPRRTVYIGTENNDTYLTDPTGSRRWWTIRVQGMVVDHHIDVQQFWAEIYSIYLQGEPWWLVGDEKGALNVSNQKHQVVSAIEDILYGGLFWDRPDRAWETAKSLLTQLGQNNLSNEQCKEAIDFLERNGCEIERKPGYPAKARAPIPRILR
jgi:putative DNA primase/helicase